MYIGCSSATGCRDDDPADRIDDTFVPHADVARQVHGHLTFLTGPWPITASLRLHGSIRTKNFFIWFWEKRLSSRVPSVVVCGKLSLRSSSSFIPYWPMMATALAHSTRVQKILGRSIHTVDIRL